MKDDQKMFDASGLSENEGRVYVAALHGGRMTLSQLSRRAAIRKTTLYPYIESLLRKGLLEKTIIGKRAHYTAGNPRKMLVAVEKHRKHLERVLPDMLTAYNNALRSPSVTTYQGVAEIRQLYEEIKENAHYLKSFWSPRGFFKTFAHSDDLAFATRLQERGVRIHSLLEYGPDSVKYLKTKHDIPQSLKILPKEYHVAINTLIFGTKVALISFENLFGLVIDNREIAQFHESMFDNLWHSLGKHQKK
ncbi:MAG: helix-turn-helix domain-containing protein [Patescibacteria group bacterium]